MSCSCCSKMKFLSKNIFDVTTLSVMWLCLFGPPMMVHASASSSGAPWQGSASSSSLPSSHQLQLNGSLAVTADEIYDAWQGLHQGHVAQKLNSLGVFASGMKKDREMKMKSIIEDYPSEDTRRGRTVDVTNGATTDKGDDTSRAKIALSSDGATRTASTSVEEQAGAHERYYFLRDTQRKAFDIMKNRERGLQDKNLFLLSRKSLHLRRGAFLALGKEALPLATLVAHFAERCILRLKSASAKREQKVQEDYELFAYKTSLTKLGQAGRKKTFSRSKPYAGKQLPRLVGVSSHLTSQAQIHRAGFVSHLHVALRRYPPPLEVGPGVSSMEGSFRNWLMTVDQIHGVEREEDEMTEQQEGATGSTEQTQLSSRSSLSTSQGAAVDSSSGHNTLADRLRDHEKRRRHTVVGRGSVSQPEPADSDGQHLVLRIDVVNGLILIDGRSGNVSILDIDAYDRALVWHAADIDHDQNRNPEEGEFFAPTPIGPTSRYKCLPKKGIFPARGRQGACLLSKLVQSLKKKLNNVSSDNDNEFFDGTNRIENGPHTEESFRRDVEAGVKRIAEKEGVRFEAEYIEYDLESQHGKLENANPSHRTTQCFHLRADVDTSVLASDQKKSTSCLFAQKKIPRGHTTEDSDTSNQTPPEEDVIVADLPHPDNLTASERAKVLHEMRVNGQKVETLQHDWDHHWTGHGWEQEYEYRRAPRLENGKFADAYTNRYGRAWWWTFSIPK
ncbi:unnamed protein product [Amoebophrya sp. A25]|nr:unnamed protein product [Amoebophrya sp. A25]|eukprot:GSA25T00014084001.1